MIEIEMDQAVIATVAVNIMRLFNGMILMSLMMKLRKINIVLVMVDN